jgi:hypothetical protein
LEGLIGSVILINLPGDRDTADMLAIFGQSAMGPGLVIAQRLTPERTKYRLLAQAVNNFFFTKNSYLH